MLWYCRSVPVSAAGARCRDAGDLGGPGLDCAGGAAAGVGRGDGQGGGGGVPADGPHPAHVRAAAGAGGADPRAGAAPPVASLLPLAGLGPGRHVHQDHRCPHLHGAGLVAQSGHRATLPRWNQKSESYPSYKG